MSFEVLPNIALTDLTALKLERQVADVADEARSTRRIDRLREAQSGLRGRGRPGRRNGDRVTIDFVGRIDGEEFEGGKGEDVDILCSARRMFIPGFVEGLEGAKAGEERTVNVKFPEDYPAQESCRQGRRLQGQGEGGRQAESARAQRRVRQDAGRRVARTS